MRTLDVEKMLSLLPQIRCVNEQLLAAVTFQRALEHRDIVTSRADLSRSAIGYGILLGCFGAGAVGGAFVMQAARTRWSMEGIVSTAPPPSLFLV
jgi:hypothetical protein